MPNDHDYDPFDEFDDPYDEDAEAELSCGQLPDGTCMLAGTEHWDFDCPYGG